MRTAISKLAEADLVAKPNRTEVMDGVIKLEAAMQAVQRAEEVEEEATRKKEIKRRNGKEENRREAEKS